MIRFSEARLSYLAHHILATLRGADVVTVNNERLALQEIKRALEGQRERETELDQIVRRKIASLSRKVPPGSREWDILYQRYMDEEHRKQNRKKS
ncbi:MAG: DUF507 family protein [Candidatus Binatia bacterium]